MMLSRGMPVSLLIHALAVVLLVMFGNEVARQPVQPPRSINVKLVQLPRTRPAQPTTDPAPTPVERQETPPDLPPKELPQPKPEVKKPEETKPEPKQPEPASPPREETTPATENAPSLSVPSITGTDTDFPFAWYVSLVEGKIVSNWQPRQLGFGKRAVVSCTVHFKIARNGRVSQVNLARNSGVGVYDREALRAVQTTRLPPLPPQYRGSELGVTFVFNLEPGS